MLAGPEDRVARFTGRFRETYTLRAPLDAARAHFADLDAVIANYGETLDRAEKRGPDTLELRLKEQNYGVTRYAGRYTCRWQVDGDRTVRWRTIEPGNLDSSGTATVEPLSDGRTRMVYDITLVLDIDVGRLLSVAIGKIVETAISREARAYVERLNAALERRVAG